MATSKATKKFQAKHLKTAIGQRKKSKEHKKKLQQRRGAHKGSREDHEPVDKNQQNAQVFDDMDVQDYFEKGIKVPNAKGKKNADSESESDPESGDESNEKSGLASDGLSESESEEEESKQKGSDDESSSEEEDDIDMDALKEKDPEFYSYLKKNDKDLLDFKPINPLDAMSDDEDDSEAEADSEDGSKPAEEQQKINVDMKLVKRWTEALSGDVPSTNAMKNVVIAFKAALHPDDEDFKYQVTEEKVFNHLMILVLQKFPLAVQKITPFKVSSNGIRNINGNAKKVAAMTQLIKSHAPSLLILLSDISNTETTSLVLQSIQELLPYLISMRKILKKVIDGIVNIWSGAKKLETQISAYAFMNNAAKEYPKSTLEIILKASYSSFIKHCRKTNVHTVALINFQKNSAAELFGLNPTLGYQIGFEFVRQLAIHLRNIVNAPTKDSYKSIYNWQFCHSLDFWSRVISSQCNPEKDLQLKKGAENPLKQLIYPLIQVTIGTVRLIPTPQFFPLRFYLIRSMIRLSQNTGVYIPLFPMISEVLNSTQFTRKARREQLPAIDFDVEIKVTKQYLNTKVYVDGLCDQIVELIGEYFVLYSKSVAFPELTTPPLIFLRRYLKKSKNVHFNRQLSILVDKLTSNAKFIEQKRATIEYGPKNKIEVAKFLQDLDWEKTPLGAYIATNRHVKEEQMKLMRESLEEDAREEAEKKARKAANDSDDEDIILEDSDASDDE